MKPQHARRKRVKKSNTPKARRPSSGVTKSCIGFLFTGALIGMLGTLLFQGLQSDSPKGVGSGLRDMMAKSRQAEAERQAQKQAPEPVLVNKSVPRAKSKFDFYTVLPEFEEVLPKDAPEPPAVKTVQVRAEKDKAKRASKPASKPVSKQGRAKLDLALGKSVYALQVASYGRRADADKLRAQLVLRGWPANIQTVSIDKKTYYRVRVGPFKDYGTMTTVDYELGKMGHKALRLRLSQGG